MSGTDPRSKRIENSASAKLSTALNEMRLATLDAALRAAKTARESGQYATLADELTQLGKNLSILTESTGTLVAAAAAKDREEPKPE